MLIACLFPITGTAESRWEVAPGRTSIGFTVKHLVFMGVDGKFKQSSGHAMANKEDFTDAVLNIEIPVGSIFTGNDNRDHDLMGDEFFSESEYPYIQFQSTSFRKTGKDSYIISGNMTIRDVTLPIDLHAKHKGQRIIGGGKVRADFQLTGELNRFDYGLRWSESDGADRLLVGEVVNLKAKIVLIKENPTLAKN